MNQLQFGKRCDNAKHKIFTPNLRGFEDTEVVELQTCKPKDQIATNKSHMMHKLISDKKEG